MTLGERICARRAAMGISQDKLAERLGVSRQSVSKWETDASVPDLDKLIRLSELFGMTLDELVKGETPREQETARQERPAEPIPQTSGGGTARMVLGGVLVTCGLLTAILLLMLNGGFWGLLIGGCLVLAGVLLLLPPAGRLITLWALWGLIVLLFLPRATGIRPTWIFSVGLYKAYRTYGAPYVWYLIVAWIEILAGVALAAATVRMLRRRKA